MYKADNLEFIGAYKTVECKKEFNVGYDTIKKYLNNSQSYKGLLFRREKL